MSLRQLEVFLRLIFKVEVMKHFLLPLMVVSWSIYYVLCDYLIDKLGSPYYVGFLLRTITLILLSVFIMGRKKSLFRNLNPKCLVTIVLIAILAFSFDCMINIGLKYSDATSGTALLKTEIIFVILFGSFVSKTKIGIYNGIMMMLMSIGSFLILLKDIESFYVDIWSLLFVISALLNTTCAFLIKKTQEKHEVSSQQIVYINNFISWMLYFVMVFLFDNNIFTELKDHCGFRVTIVTFFCGICQTTLMLTYYQALKKHPVWVVKTILLVIPIGTMIINYVFFDEYITSIQFVGMSIVTLSSLSLILNKKN